MKVMHKSHASESFSHFVVALIGATVIVGAAAWAFSASQDICASKFPCRTAAQMAEVHY